MNPDDYEHVEYYRDRRTGEKLTPQAYEELVDQDDVDGDDPSPTADLSDQDDVDGDDPSPTAGLSDQIE